ncbi:2-desacetyl-2-hydroxyethyl bacteriochlorophyllide A dehydrogenase [Methylobacterium aerolatum]|uniref:2-desacetyl-2-hydroxyethyl bacteriochlorophyllide A dehydrogenase n=1 Tax=Methylobacterium aerolatum TaxID=418708 RepID=A0ABU0HUL9_9HYPH|nr:2-desacetyl-2-hydroxyethyl bacteriochlorophyllide A dehydrogenase [Methylobacterium aerolatum]
MHHPEGSETAGRAGSRTTALWYTAPGRAELRHEALPPAGPGDVVVETLWTALSRGTERLVFHGLVPDALHGRMRAPAQEGPFSFPVKYGYCAVGRIADPAGGASPFVFALRPHQARFVAPRDGVHPVPPGVPPRRAILAANMETALNAVWDSGAGPGDRIAVVGGGAVGLLAAFLASGIVGCEVTVIDRLPERASLARHLGVAFAAPGTAPRGEADVVFHASASQEGLAEALSLAGDEGRVVEMSWYGTRPVSVPLGEDFHVRRLSLMSSQVGQVSASRRPRWTYARRMGKALDLLADPRLDALITGEVAFADLPEALPRLLAPEADGLCTAVRY